MISITNGKKAPLEDGKRKTWKSKEKTNFIVDLVASTSQTKIHTS
jgi:hypothetical protein